MTDGRIPGKWINEPRFIEMSADAWCVFSKAIAWSNEAGTDGQVKRRYLSLLHPDGEKQAACQELVSMGLWAPTADGYQLKDWSKPAHQGGLGQSTADQVKSQKDRKKKNQADYRDRMKNSPDDDPNGGVTGDVTGHVSGDVGQDRTGQGREATEETNSSEALNPFDLDSLPEEVPPEVDLETGEVFDDEDDDFSAWLREQEHVS